VLVNSLTERMIFFAGISVLLYQPLLMIIYVIETGSGGGVFHHISNACPLPD